MIKHPPTTIYTLNIKHHNQSTSSAVFFASELVALQVLLEPGQETLPDFLAEHKVHVIASLPSGLAFFLQITGFRWVLRCFLKFFGW